MNTFEVPRSNDGGLWLLGGGEQYQLHHSIQITTEQIIFGLTLGMSPHVFQWVIRRAPYKMIVEVP